MSIRVHSWLNPHNEAVVVIHPARRRDERAADLRSDQAGAIHGRRAQVSAQPARRRRADAAGHSVVSVERQQ